MANLTPLRNIHLSGGLFTENLLLKIRDKKDQIPEVQWNTFGDKWQEEKKRYYEVWDWAKRLFGEIADSLDTWTIEERYEKWIKPLLQKLGYEGEPKPSIDLTTLSEEEQDSILNRIQVSHQLKNLAKIGLHICEDENFDERNDTNYQKKSQHDHFQRFILLNEGVRWGFLSNGKHVRLLGEYSNIYAKGYIQFNLDSIFINKDESEFWVFYALIHLSRFNETYGLNPSDWIDKLKKKWLSISKKLSSEDADNNSNIISEDVLNVYKKNLNDLIERANDKGVMAIKSSDSEIFMQTLKEKRLDLGEIGRDFYLKELDSVISDINENLSIMQRLQKRSQEEGIEAGKKLRKNVKKALELMGEGLINSSKAFTEDILKGNVEIKGFYQELLRITYRIIFILYAEAKDLLPGVATIYYNDLGLTFLRKKAQQLIRDDQNTDLWYRLLLLFKYLNNGELSLGINAFSGELFNPEKVPSILDEKYSLSLPNSILLKIIYELTIIDLGIGLQLMNYSEIGEEEIGSIYEALLDFQPRYKKEDSPTYHFILEEIDTERKGSGTYYTPKGLIDILLKTALKPVIEYKIKELKSKEEKLNALLDLKICDPACGGGSFLLASIDYLGKIYAQIESGEEIPDENILRESRREVLQHCIYGVDLNPMAIELTKISLWLKAAVKDKPLTFLDSHLKVGDSLIGFTKKIKIKKIPDNAFNAVKGNKETAIPDDIKENVVSARKRLKDFRVEAEGMVDSVRSVQKTLFPYQDSDDYAKVAFEVFQMEENNLDSIKDKQKCYLKLRQTKSWKNLNLQCNLWTSAFFWRMGQDFIKNTPNDTLIFNAKRDSIDQNNPTVGTVNNLKEEYKFFNWFLEFPEVFQKDDAGFDCILMNPPWEVLTLKEMEYFLGKSREIVAAKKQSERRKLIKDLIKKDSKLHDGYKNEYFSTKKKSFYFSNCGYFPNSSEGSKNLYALFIERSRNIINSKGKIGCVVQNSLLTGSNLSILFRDLIENNSIDSIFGFRNERMIFDIAGDHTLEFCLLTLSSKNSTSHNIPMAFNIWDVIKIQKSLENYENGIKEDEFKRDIREGGSIINFDPEDFKLFNPNKKNSPIFKRKIDYKLVKKAYLKTSILIKKDGNEVVNNPWKIKFKIIFHMSKDSENFKSQSQLRDLEAKPISKKYDGGCWESESNVYNQLYTGSAIWLYDHRYNEIIPKKKVGKRKTKTIRVSDEIKKDPEYFHLPYYWVEKSIVDPKIPEFWHKNWFLGFRNIAASNLKRTFIFTAIPKSGAGNSFNLILNENFRKEIICLYANFASIPLDYVVRNKMSGININYFFVEQLPLFKPEIFNDKLFQEISKRVIELVYTAWDMQSFAVDFGFSDKKPPYKWDVNRRLVLKSELDAIFFLMYGYSKKEVEYILNTFFVLRDKELKNFGEYRTKYLVLNAYEDFNSDENLGPIFRLES